MSNFPFYNKATKFTEKELYSHSIPGNNHKSGKPCILNELHDNTKCHLCMLVL